MLRLSPFITVYCCAVAALLGACTGSFLGCLAWRTVHGESVLRGRSHCDVCGQFRNGIASTRPGKLAKVPPVMQAKTAPAAKEMMPTAENPGRREKFSRLPLPTIQ